MSDKSKKRARALMKKTGMTYQAAVNVLRQSRQLPKFAGFSSADRLMFRPFVAEARHGFSVPMSGEVVGDNFVVGVFGQQVRLKTIEVLRDQSGLVAVLAPGAYLLDDGLMLEVELEADEPTGDYEPSISGVLSVYREARAHQAIAEEVQRRVGPVNLIVPREMNVSLHFHTDGTLERWQRPTGGQN